MKTLEQDAAEANRFHARVGRHLASALLNARRAGAALVRAKKRVRSEGMQFGLWLRENFRGSHEKANLYMRISRDWGYLEEELLKHPEMSINEAIAYLRSRNRPPARHRFSGSPIGKARLGREKTDGDAFDKARHHLASELARRLTEEVAAKDIFEFSRNFYSLDVKCVEHREDGLRLTVVIVEYVAEEDGWTPDDCVTPVDVAEQMMSAL